MIKKKKLRYKKFERRIFNRVNGRFIVSYNVLGDKSIFFRDISQTKNISKNGLLFTADRPLPTLTNLAIKLKLPITPNPIDILGEVVGTREIVRNLIYETRVHFTGADKNEKEAISKMVKCFLKMRKSQVTSTKKLNRRLSGLF